MQDAIIVGLGSAARGDDAAGILVAEALAKRGFDAIASSDPTMLLPLLVQGKLLIVVDTVLGGGRAGDIVNLSPRQLDARPSCASTHGLSLTEVLRLGAALRPQHALADVHIVGIVIEKAPCVGRDVSKTTQRAAARVADHVARMALGIRHGLR